MTSACGRVEGKDEVKEGELKREERVRGFHDVRERERSKVVGNGEEKKGGREEK